MKDRRWYIVALAIGMLIANSQWLTANDTVYVSGSVQHDGLFPTRDVSTLRNSPRARWAKIDHLSNNYLDLSVHYLRMDSNAARFHGVHADTRLEQAVGGGGSGGILLADVATGVVVGVDERHDQALVGEDDGGTVQCGGLSLTSGTCVSVSGIPLPPDNSPP